MKSIKDIENITIEELETISFDKKIAVPSNLSEKIYTRIGSQEKKRYSFISAAAAVIVIVAGLSLSLPDKEPEDTFDNPYLAYAELEKTLSLVSGSMKKGMDMVGTSESIIGKSAEIFK